MTRSIPFLLIFALLLAACTRPSTIGQLQFEYDGFSIPVYGTHANYWIKTFGSPEFAAFVARSNAPSDVALIKKVLLVPEDRGVVSVRAIGVQKSDAARVTTLVARSINAYSKEQLLKDHAESQAGVQKLLEDPTYRAQYGAKLLQNLEASEARLKRDVTYVLERK